MKIPANLYEVMTNNFNIRPLNSIYIVASWRRAPNYLVAEIYHFSILSIRDGVEEMKVWKANLLPSDIHQRVSAFIARNGRLHYRVKCGRTRQADIKRYCFFLGIRRGFIGMKPPRLIYNLVARGASICWGMILQSLGRNISHCSVIAKQREAFAWNRYYLHDLCLEADFACYATRAGGRIYRSSHDRQYRSAHFIGISAHMSMISS